MAVSLLHEARVIANGDAPVFELTPMTIDRAQFHHHLIRVKVQDHVDAVLHDQR